MVKDVVLFPHPQLPGNEKGQVTMKLRGMWRALLALSIVALGLAGSATASGEDSRGIDPNQGDSLVEVIVPSKAAAIDLQNDAESLGIEFNDHYLGKNANGTFTVTVFGSEGELHALADAGYELGATIEGPETWEAGLADMTSARRADNRAEAAALGDPPVIADDDELVILRADYFENYAGRFLSVEAKNRLGGATPPGSTYVGPATSVSWNTGAGTAIDEGPRPMNVNIDPDTTPDTYIEHRILIRIGDIGSGPAAPTRIRIGSSTGAMLEGNVAVWLAGGLPPHAAGLPVRLHDAVHGPDRGLPAVRRAGGGVRHRRDGPSAVPDERVPAQGAGQHGRLPDGRDPPASAATRRARNRVPAVVLTSRAWGHEGGNDITAEFVNPACPTSR